jgi:hypothetical protein
LAQILVHGVESSPGGSERFRRERSSRGKPPHSAVRHCGQGCSCRVTLVPREFSSQQNLYKWILAGYTIYA